MSVISLAIAAIMVGALLLLWILQAPNRSRRSRRSTLSRPPRQILTLLNGDTAAAQRLYEKVRFNNPGKSDQWYWEKVLWDLERDRRW
jgi:hypothetical protein